MANPIIVRVVFCGNTVFGDTFCVYYASGRTHDYRGGESVPKRVFDFCDTHTKVVDKIKGENHRYIKWE